MFQATFDVIGVSSYSQSRMILDEKKGENETHAEFDERTYLLKTTHDKDGTIVLPATAIISSIVEAVAKAGEKRPGKGQATWKKAFMGALMMETPMVLMDAKGKPYNIHSNPPAMEKTPCDAQGKKGGSGGSTVIRCFPVFHEWSTRCQLICFNDEITPAKLEEYAKLAGRIVGIGRWRPQNNGLYGRYAISNFKTSKIKAD